MKPVLQQQRHAENAALCYAGTGVDVIEPEGENDAAGQSDDTGCNLNISKQDKTSLFYISIHRTRYRFMFPYYIMKEQFGQEACETAKGLLYYITIRLPMIGRGGNVDDTEGTCNVA